MAEHYLAVTLDDALYERLERLAREKGTSLPELVAYAVRRYLEGRDMTRARVITITVKVYEEQLEKLEQLAREKGTNRSELIRRAIDLYLKLETFKTEKPPRVIRIG